MIICKIDAARSTDALDKRGHAVTVEIRAQLDTFLTRMLKDLPNESLPNDPFRFHGERQGDGLMLGAPRTHALEVLRTALTIRDEPPWQHPSWLPVRMSLGIATVSWDREPYGVGSVPNGRDIIIISRLLEECPPGSIVVNQALLLAIREYGNELLALFEERQGELKGIEGMVVYGLVPPRPKVAFSPIVTRWRVFTQSRAGAIILWVGSVAWGWVVRWLMGWLGWL